MNFKAITHQSYLETIPKEGRHILGQQTEDKILVYQAFNHAIANYALEHQKFGGNAYSFSRMSWIKPNFLWMMFRCGWASKPNQERVLGLWIKKTDFDHILGQSVFSSYQADLYGAHENWKCALEAHPVRLQWDPDHDIYGNKQERKAIQLGIKGDLLKIFGQEMVQEIIDVTDFVIEQKRIIDRGETESLLIPSESIYSPSLSDIRKRIGLES